MAITDLGELSDVGETQGGAPCGTLLAVIVSAAPAFVHYLPIATTALSAAFLVALLRHGRLRSFPPHLAWWSAGVLAYGAGTALESAITLFGNSSELTRWWYVAGALFGGYPLATGSVYLLCRRRVAHALTAVSSAIVVALSVAVLLSPLDLAQLEPHRPSGAVLGWRWIRLCTPAVNLYAAAFLVGGALVSAVRFWLMAPAPGAGERAAGTALIAFGGVLPGIGGAMAKAGVVEGLYVGELVGIVAIWAGHSMCRRAAAGPEPRAAVELVRDWKPG
ncbi:MAG TPA: hypothetical protein VFD82_08200 [Planctomycetota bacterium]|nr:hypothetical protein [Planctomycetota bacterium]